MNGKQLSIEQKILKDRIDELYKRSKPAILTLLVICTIYIYILFLSGKFAGQPLFVWYLVLVGVLLGRLLLTRFYARAQNRTKSLSFWLQMFRLGMLVASLTIGSLNFLFFPREPLSSLLLAIIFPYGIVAAAATVLPDFISVFIYVITLMMPIVYQTVLVGDRFYSGTAILTFIMILFYLKVSKEYNDNFISNMRLRYENKTLVEELQQEKNKINNRLGRILNDSSNEIFVVDADSLNCLQVNKGAVENLGYSQDEFADINLLDIFTDLNRRSFAKLIAPLYDGRKEIILYKGMSRRKDSTTYPVEARIQLSTRDIPPIIVITVQDITERTEWERKMVYQANFDQLTGLLNRHYMYSFMDSAFTRARRKRKKVALLFMDLDNFKDINDTLGHDIGDEVLKQTANRIRTLLRESDTPARTGGDEFTVLLEDLEEISHAEVVSRKLVDLFKQPFWVKGRKIYTSVSIGMSIYPDDGELIDQLMQYADMAMYRAKEDGRNNYCFFSREMCRASEEQMLVMNYLRNALTRGEFSLFFQPKVDIIKGRIVGAEALLRWHNPELGEVSPEKFIPLAENMGFIESIGTWVLEAACREAMRWPTLTSEYLHVSVNISPQQFRTGTLISAVDRALAGSGLSCDRLELEITENLLLQDSENLFTILKTLCDRGIRLALDDFGTGYSSLSYLKRFPLQVLKIDRSFIHDLEENKNSRALVEAIIAMAHSMKLGIVAEGIENEEQLNFLRQRDVEIIQGYFFSPPVSAEQFCTLLKDESMAAEIERKIKTFMITGKLQPATGQSIYVPS